MPLLEDDKFIVINKKHLKSKFEGDVEDLDCAIEKLQLPDNKYFVCNQDEEYAQTIIGIILAGEKKKELSDETYKRLNKEAREKLLSTGRKDITGKIIREGDVIEGTLDDNYSLPTRGTVVYFEKDCAFCNKNDAGLTLLMKITDIEIVEEAPICI